MSNGFDIKVPISNLVYGGTKWDFWNAGKLSATKVDPNLAGNVEEGSILEYQGGQWIASNASGIAGPQGATGATGTQGPEGPIGMEGPPGETGPTGEIGPTGPEGPIGMEGPQGQDGLDGAVTLRYILENVSGFNPSGATYFSSCCNINLVSTNSFKFSYTSLSGVPGEGFFDVINNAILNGQTPYLQISQVNNTSIIAVYKVNSVNYSDPGNGGQYNVGVDGPPAIYGNGIWNVTSIYAISFSINGSQGPTGPAGGGGLVLPPGTNYSDYLYWNPSPSPGEWQVGSSQVHIGQNAGLTTPGTNTIAIGVGAGENSQGEASIAIGFSAGQTNQVRNSIAIGNSAGNSSQQEYAISFGQQAGQTSQQEAAIAIGRYAGNNNQQVASIALGIGSGQFNQQAYSVAIGANAGFTNQGSNCIAIGQNAGQNNQVNNSIILNASSSSLEATGSSGFFVAPVRNTPSTHLLYYNPGTSEISYQNILTGYLGFSSLFYNGV